MRHRPSSGLILALLAWLLIDLAPVLPAQTWSLLSPQALTEANLVYDSARHRTVLFGGQSFYSPPGNDTWEFDGSRWRQIATIHAAPRQSSAAYDSLRQRIVAVTVTSQGSVQTWEYDGIDWSLATTAHTPPSSGAMAYDSARQRCVMFGYATTAGQTWEYDGMDWTRRLTVTVPTLCTVSMAYDSSRQRMVMAGSLGFPYAAGAYEFDSVDWVRLPGNSGPSGPGGMTFDTTRNVTVFVGIFGVWELHSGVWTYTNTNNSPDGPSCGVTYDSQRQRTLVFGGDGYFGSLPNDSLWSYDGTIWQEELPHPRKVANAVVHDAALSRFVLFGTTDLYGQAANDTWFLDRTGWSRHPTVTAPSPRVGHALAYDSRRRASILFGGNNATGTAEGDTWLFDGSQWQTFVSVSTPAARHSHAMVFDSVRSRVVLFGGTSGNWLTYDDTWEFGATGWHQVTTATTPQPRFGHAMVYDSARGRTVMVGGHDTWRTLGSQTDTWQFDGNNWQLVPTTPAPPARYGHSLVFVPSRGRTLLFGGFNGFALFDDLWQFDGSHWSLVPMTTRPLYRERASMAYDSKNDRVVLVGGILSQATGNSYWLTDVWQLSLPSTGSFARHGLGCPTGTGTPSLDANGSPARGTSLPLQLTNLPHRATVAALLLGTGIDQWQGAPLPVDLGSFGLAGCQLWVDITPGLCTFAASSSGTAAWSLPIPNLPAMAGVRLAMQALVLDSLAGNGVGMVSNAGVAVIP